MEKNLDLIAEKYGLIDDANYKRIRELQIEHILSLVNSNIEPLVIKGMLKTISDTDKWKDDFIRQKKIQDKELNC